MTGIDPELNLVTIGEEEDLFSRCLRTEPPSWVAGQPPASEFEAMVKVRYKTPPAPATVRVSVEGLEIEFDRRLRAITPGQAAVLYDGDRVIGGATIADTF